MINPFEVIETIKMVDEENLDIRTITMGISLKSCAGPDVDTVCEKVYEKITTYAKDLVKTGEDIEAPIRYSDYQQENFGNSDSYFGGRIGRTYC